MKKNEIEILSQNEHVLKRTGRYIGSIKHVSQSMFILENDKMVYKTVDYVPGLIKIVRELIDNSCDEFVRTNGKFATQIKVEVDKEGYITIYDNGRGIPVEKVKGTNMWAPEAAWTELRAGANFKDEADNVTIGQNGEGAALSCILAKHFVGITSDGLKRFKIICKDNLTEKNINIKDCADKYTEIRMLPDYERFGLKNGLDEVHEKIIKTDLFNLAMSYPDISFYYNKERIKIRNFKQYMEMFSEHFEVSDTDFLSVGVAVNASDDFNYVNYINGCNCYEGGNPLTYVINTVVGPLCDKMTRSYKSIKPGDIKNKLTFVVFFKNMINPRFDNQMKSKCINVPADFKNNIEKFDFDNFVTKIYRNKELTDPIIETFKIREELKSRQELNKIEKNVKKIRCDKFLAPTKEWKYFALCEGDSAQNSVASVLGRENCGSYAMRGVPLNGYDCQLKKITENKELVEIIGILGLSFDKDKNQSLRFENILISTDFDLDGFKITGLLIGFFFKYASHILKEGRLKRFRTPIVILKTGDKVKHHFFTFDEFNKFQQKHDIKKFELSYKKGLGSWKKEELQQLIVENGLEYFIETLSLDADAAEYIDNWFKDDKIENRKEYLRNNSFSIFNI